MKNARILGSHRMWIWFILTSIIISLLVMLISGSLQMGRNMRADAPLDEFEAHTDERIPTMMKLYGIPGCNIALVQGNEVVWTEAYGYADLASGRVLTIDTSMSVQSITKSVTAWGVMRLREKELIDLDASVSQYLKSWQFPLTDYPTEKTTVRQLLSHTAGMPLGDFTNIYSPGEVMPSNRDVMTDEVVLMHEPMGRIIWGHYGLCVVIGMLVSASLLVILRLVSTFYQQKRARFKLLRVSAAFILLGILIWCACQKYLFIISVFPILSMWFGGTAFVFSIVLLLSVVLSACPRKKDKL